MGNFDFTPTASFHPGVQKVRLFSEAAVRYPLLFFAFYAIAVSAVFFRCEEKYTGPVDILISLTATMPMGIQLAGGASPRAWRLYFLFAVFAVVAISIPYAGGPFIFLSLLAPALFFLAAFHRAAPHVIREFGYLEKIPLWRESLMTVILAIIFPALVFYIIKLYGNIRPADISPERYIVLAVSCIVLYTPLFGIMFGITTRRLLALKFQLIVPILINTFILSFFFMPTSLMHDTSAVTILILLVCSLVIQMGLGLAFYYCRSARFIIVFYVVYYLCYKTWGI